MMCPVCKRELAPTLSICLTCGAMMNDSVREELETKISSCSGGLSARKPEPEPPRQEFRVSTELPKPAAPELRTSPRPMTAELSRKHTSPTLVEFQNKNATLPDWRLQIQNSVRQRGVAASAARVSDPAVATAHNTVQATSGSNALKLEIESVPLPPEKANPRLASAIKRIEESRRAYMPKPDRTAAAARSHSDGNQRRFPFEVVTPTDAPSAKAKIPEPVEPVQKPKLVSALKIEKKPFDTNKLPRLDTVVKEPKKAGHLIDSEEIEEPLFTAEPENEELQSNEVKSEEREIFKDMYEDEELDDLAPFSMRFGAGLFDFIIGGFATLIILSPFIMGGGTWVSVSGVLTLTGSLAVFMFLYLTASLAFWGKTFGMRIFSLELIDAEINAYPTVHQAAVNSAVYLLSMAFAGLGFLTIPFSEEKRAVHDIVSGTLLVREV